MIDALLFAVRDTLRAAGFGWDKATCDLQADGHPPAFSGSWYLSIHGGQSRGTMRNARDEYTGFVLSLTRRVDAVPRDRLGDQLLCNRLSRTLAIETGFNSRAQQIATFLDSNWAVIATANQYLVEMYAASYQVNGFCEPAMWESTEDVKLVGGEWFSAEPEAADTGIVCEIRFKDARRLEPIGTYT